MSCVAKADNAQNCSGYQDSQASVYALPYPVGEEYRVAQGNCSPPPDGHRGTEKYAYDFDMAIGTPFVAIRAGFVTQLERSHADGDIAASGSDNYIVVRHDDGTHALYAHLAHNGADVELNSRVAQGQTIGHSGNTGNTNNFPHLHLAVHVCDPVANGSASCPTWPLTFRNTTPNPTGLKRGQTYRAE